MNGSNTLCPIKVKEFEGLLKGTYLEWKEKDRSNSLRSWETMYERCHLHAEIHRTSERRYEYCLTLDNSTFHFDHNMTTHKGGDAHIVFESLFEHVKEQRNILSGISGHIETTLSR